MGCSSSKAAAADLPVKISDSKTAAPTAPVSLKQQSQGQSTIPVLLKDDTPNKKPLEEPVMDLSAMAPTREVSNPLEIMHDPFAKPVLSHITNSPVLSSPSSYPITSNPPTSSSLAPSSAGSDRVGKLPQIGNIKMKKSGVVVELSKKEKQDVALLGGKNDNNNFNKLKTGGALSFDICFDDDANNNPSEGMENFHILQYPSKNLRKAGLLGKLEPVRGAQKPDGVTRSLTANHKLSGGENQEISDTKSSFRGISAEELIEKQKRAEERRKKKEEQRKIRSKRREQRRKELLQKQLDAQNNSNNGQNIKTVQGSSSSSQSSSNQQAQPLQTGATFTYTSIEEEQKVLMAKGEIPSLLMKDFQMSQFSKKYGQSGADFADLHADQTSFANNGETKQQERGFRYSGRLDK